VQIRGIEGWTLAHIEAELQAGGRFVYFESCISFVFVTWRGASDVYLLRKGERGVVRGLPYLLVTLLLGWWGLPWGLVYTPQVLLTNLGGGRDVTEQTRALLRGGAGLGCAADGPGGGS